MPALQSFSLPRSGPRVTARPCPPVVPRQRRRDYEALFRSEVRHSRGSWPIRTARCSPGLPRLEPHTGTRTKTGRSGGRFRDASATNARRLATPCARGRKRGTASLPRPISKHQDRLRHHVSGVLAGLSPGRTVVLPSRTRSAPRVRRMPATRSARRAGAQATSEVSWTSWPVVSTAEAIDPLCSAAFREVGGRRRGGPRCRWVDRVSVRHPGSGDRSEDPRIGEAKEGSSERQPRGSIRSLPRASLRDEGRPDVRVDVLQA